MKRYLALLLSVLVVSCGGGGGDSGGNTGGSAATSTPATTGASTGDTGSRSTTPGDTPSGGDSGGGGGTDTSSLPQPGTRVEENDTAVTLTGEWTNTSPRMGWSGGAAVQSSVAGATATISFKGTSIRWLSARGRDMGVARVSIDNGPAKEVNLRQNTGVIVRTPAITIHDLSDGPHTLKIEVVSGVVWVDAFDVQPQTTVSHWQETNPGLIYSAGWTKASTDQPWSGNGARNPPELPPTAQETYTAGETLTVPFRGTAISWVGYRGPDGGIAVVQIDGGAPIEVDTYSPSIKYQEVVFTATGLADTNHTLTITATGGSNPASTAARIVVDALEVMTPGRRYENDDPAVTYDADGWNLNHIARFWSGGSAATSNVNGNSATFSFTGTSVSVIGCRKGTAGGTARFYIDGVLVSEIRMKETYPIEGYQVTVFRIDGLTNSAHTLKVEVASPTGGSYVVVDAFDVHP